jgi:hypothetical protein
MNIYLSARFARQAELCGYRDELIALGHTVTSRWLDAETADDDGISLPNTWSYQARDIAEADLDDIYVSDCFVAFTDPPGVGPMRGSHHVEFGLALGMRLACRPNAGMRLLVVGPRENVFHCLDCVSCFSTWDAMKRYLPSLR